MPTKRLLIVDDEVHILELLRYNLEHNGYEVVEASSGEAALDILMLESIDLVILDWMLPEMNGLEVLKVIRGQERLTNLPVIMLTAKGTEIDKVLGLEMGADDYLGKPFGVHELLARVKAVLRRFSKVTKSKDEKTTEDEQIRVGDLVINRTNREVKVGDRTVELPLKEFELLYLMAKHRGRVFEREYLLEQIWGYDYYGETRTVDVHIRNLRKKIELDDSHPLYIKTVRGVGYKFS